MPPFLDEPPISPSLTAYDREHMVLPRDVGIFTNLTWRERAG